MEQILSGKVAIVTGGGSGIGRATATLYAANGAKVVISDMDEKGGAETVKMIQDVGGDAHFIKTDVGKPAECEAMVKQTVEKYGRLDIACNNAGISGESNPVADVTVAGWDKVISINLSSVFYCMKYQIPAMLKDGGGSIVNMASILGKVGFMNSSGYVAAKHGVVGLTETAALEYSAKGVRVNAIGPGFIDTPLLEKAGMGKEEKDMLVKLHPIGRLGKPEEIAELVLWLSSDKASFVTGAYYNVDGGYLAQ